MVLAGGIATGPAAAPAAAVPAEPVGGPLLGSTGLVVRLPPGLAAPPAVTAAAYVVADLDTGEVLAAKAPHLRLSPASTLKILTAYTLLPRLDPALTHVGTRADENVDGSRVGIVAGHTYRLPELWYGLLLASGNDAANALATMAGGVPRTLRLMQAEAARLQANDTLASTPSGLDSDTGPGPFSSAYDLALITRAAYQLPRFKAYVGTRMARFPGRGSKRFEIYNQNDMLWRYRGATGVKTGFTSKARNTFVGAATRDGHSLVVTLLLSKHGVRDDAMKLLDWGFAARGRAEPVGKLVEPLAEAPPANSQPGAPGAATPTPGAPLGSGQDGSTPAAAQRGRTGSSRLMETAMILAAGLAVLLFAGSTALRTRRRP